MGVMGVTGKLEGQDLGRTLVHEHILISYPGEELDPSYNPDRTEIKAIAIDRLQELKSKGVSTIVDPCPIELGRDPELYAEVSQRSGVNVVFATGFYFEAQGVPLYWRVRDAEEIAEFYLKELTDGVGKTGLRPGVIKAATGLEVTPVEEKVLTGAAMASREAGCAIITHTENSRHGDRQQEIFAKGGADLSRVLIGHQDEQTSVNPIIALAERGTFVGMDRIGLEALAPDARRADHVAAVLKAGHLNRMCLSQDCVCALTSPRYPFNVNLPPEMKKVNPLKSWVARQKPLSYVVTTFAPMLQKRGVSDSEIETMLRDNPRRLLTGED
jgi:phosphotriesterase-related protein